MVSKPLFPPKKTVSDFFQGQLRIVYSFQIAPIWNLLIFAEKNDPFLTHREHKVAVFPLAAQQVLLANFST
jgi:hypothetical protein